MCYLHTLFKAQIIINHECDTEIMPILLIHCPLEEDTKTLLFLNFLLL